MTDISIPPGGAPDRTGGPSRRDDTEIATLRDLHTRLVDTLQGYTAVVEKAAPEFVAIVWEIRGLHQRQAGRVQAMLLELGDDPRCNAFVFGPVNRAVIEVRGRSDDVRPRIIDVLVDGERRLLADFKAAIAASSSVERCGMLDQMCREIIMLLLCGEIVMLLQRRATELPAGSPATSLSSLVPPA